LIINETAVCIELIQKSSANHSHSFRIRKTSGESFHFACDSKEELASWVTHIQHAKEKQDSQVSMVTGKCAL